MSQIYQHKQNTPSFNFELVWHIAIVIAFALVLLTTAQAQTHEDLPYQIDMSKHLDYNATIDDALLLCDFWNGIYEPEHDVCHVGTEIIKD